MNSNQRLLLIAGIVLGAIIIPWLFLSGAGDAGKIALGIGAMAGAIAYFAILASAKIGHAKTAIGITLFILGVIALYVSKVTVQGLINDFASDRSRSLAFGESGLQRGIAQVQALQSSLDILGYAYGALGLVILLAGLLQKRAEKESSAL